MAPVSLNLKQTVQLRHQSPIRITALLLHVLRRWLSVQRSAAPCGL